jgi:hypothetical protein
VNHKFERESITAINGKVSQVLFKQWLLGLMHVYKKANEEVMVFLLLDYKSIMTKRVIYPFVPLKFL